MSTEAELGIPVNRESQLSAWWLLTLLAMIGMVAIITGVVLAYRTDDQWFDNLWLEVAKAGVQVVAVGVLGGALAATWRIISANREARLERKNKIRAELASLVALYNDVKAVRRILRSLGLDLKTYADAEEATVRDTIVLTKEQALGFQEQMLVLSHLQLEFEAKVRQFGQTNFLGDDTETVVQRLNGIENHLNKVLALWEQKGWRIREGFPLVVVSDGLKGLFRVREHLRPAVSEPLREITRIINKHAFGEASPKTQRLFTRLSQADDEP